MFPDPATLKVKSALLGADSVDPVAVRSPRLLAEPPPPPPHEAIKIKIIEYLNRCTS